MDKFNPLNMIICEGAVEILECIKDGEPKRFNELKQLINPRTHNCFSPKTIIDRTKELIELGALKKVVIETKEGRDVIGYKITEKGKKALEVSLTYEQELKKVFSE